MYWAKRCISNFGELEPYFLGAIGNEQQFSLDTMKQTAPRIIACLKIGRNRTPKKVILFNRVQP